MHDTNALFIKLKLAIEVGRFAEMARVSAAIEFNRKLRLRAKEIEDPIADTMLSAKL